MTTKKITPDSLTSNTINIHRRKTIVLIIAMLLSAITINISHAKPHTKPQTRTNAQALVNAARAQIGVTTRYDPAYVRLAYPMGDVPISRGVCTDVIIRAYRKQGKDLQVLVNNDMKRAWRHYPKLWGLKRTDKNIDHRRVPNLEVFFKRHGKQLPISKNKASYQAGDIVTWRLNAGGKNLPHIGIVSNKTSWNGTPLIIHNIGSGTQEENMLFHYKITGHFRY